MPVLLLLLPLLQFIGLPDNGSGATSTRQLQVVSQCPLPSLQTSAAACQSGAAHSVGGR